MASIKTYNRKTTITDGVKPGGAPAPTEDVPPTDFLEEILQELSGNVRPSGEDGERDGERDGDESGKKQEKKQQESGQQEKKQQEKKQQESGQQEQEAKPDDLFHRAVVAVNEAEGFVRSSELDEFARKLEGINGPSNITIKLPDGGIEKREIEGSLHAQFEEVCKRVAAGQDVMLVGPAGCGKTTLAEQVARALGLEFGTLSCTAGTPESHIIGRALPDKTGEFVYRPTMFVKIAENGGLFLADEFDAADANVMLVFNQYLANGRLPIPFREEAPVALRHKNARFIAACNTFGRGADRQYVGRNQLDEATLDRFACNVIEVDYDRKLEKSLVDPKIAETFWKLRDAVIKHKLRRVVSTRAMVKAHTLVHGVGMKLDRVMSDFLSGWTPDERTRVGF